MNRYYTKTSIYLDDRQKKLINEYLPYKMSSFVRDILDYVLFKEIEGSPEFMAKPELFELFYEYKQYLQKNNITLEQRQKIKKELFDFYDSLADGVVAFVLANKGKNAAISYCKQTLEAFRNKGYYISDELARELIIEYVRMLHDTGKDDEVWERRQREYELEYGATVEYGGFNKDWCT